LGQPVPAPRHEHSSYDGLKVTRTLSYNEQDVSDKPSWIRKAPTLTNAQQAEIDVRHENRVESLQSVDDLVAGVVGKLSEKTYWAAPTSSLPPTTDFTRASTA
jgi:hypothetical protein